MKKILIILTAIYFCFNISSCGKKSPLSPPNGSEYPRKYPPE